VRRRSPNKRVTLASRAHGKPGARLPEAAEVRGPVPVLATAIRALRTTLPEASRPEDPAPIWLAALMATSCQAEGNGEQHTVRWHWVAGRALYTNAGCEAEHIAPLGVSLMGGHTMAVSWMPGETAYTVEVFRQATRYA